MANLITPWMPNSLKFITITKHENFYEPDAIYDRQHFYHTLFQPIKYLCLFQFCKFYIPTKLPSKMNKPKLKMKTFWITKVKGSTPRHWLVHGLNKFHIFIQKRLYHVLFVCKIWATESLFSLHYILNPKYIAPSTKNVFFSFLW